MPPSSSYTSSYHSPPSHHGQHRRHRNSTSSSSSVYSSPVASTPYYSNHAANIDDLDDAAIRSRAPNCSVCDAPAKNQCGCELASLIVAVEESEQKIMGAVWDDIRRWVTSRAQSSIHNQFHSLSSQRRSAFSAHIAARRHSLSTYDLDALHHQLQRDIDSDWRACVQQYPEVLDHYYGIITDAVRNGRGVGEIIHGGSERTSSRGDRRGGGDGGGRRMRVVYE
ncbi:hypothetical protein FN846DRAFT_885914 [Sphaerosporella brunnea]|uniref:Uncharacterized protein n=1 Tax=Sphaerosporella brunnea TaxID=1250544 RepID=A0A5J5FBQ6_9PEZI|nr:hypothetical protein FN846DRAFT_885914 [Sphaerosporella brunnea]